MKSILTAALLLSASLLHADVPALINYQGLLTDINGNVVSGSKTVSISIHDAATNGTQLYTESIGSVTVQNGIYSFQFGSGPTFTTTLATGSQYWLQVTLDGVPQTPRERLVSVPFAMRAGTVPDGSITSSKLALGAVSTSLPVGTALLSSSPVDPTLQGQGYVRLDSGLSIGSATMFVYQRQADSLFRYALADPDGAELLDAQAAPVDLGSVTTVPAQIVLTLRNLGNQTLTGLNSMLDGANASEFTTNLGASTLPPGSTTTITVGFNPFGSNGTRSAALHFSATGVPGSFDLNLTGVVDVPEGFVLVPVGSFIMGRTSGDTDSNAPPSSVTLNGYYIQKTETTKELWDDVRAWGLNNGYTDLNAGNGKATNHPVGSISWFDAVKWCNARSEKSGLTPSYTILGAPFRTGMSVPTVNWSANGYRLPTEAEWEKAARGGIVGARFSWGTDTISHQEANFLNTGGETYTSGTTGYHPNFASPPAPYTSPIASFGANGYGLHDMTGNIWEWCWDWYSFSYYTISNGTSDPRGPSSGTVRIYRGGGWDGSAAVNRSARRGINRTPDEIISSMGFRSARSH